MHRKIYRLIFAILSLCCCAPVVAAHRAVAFGGIVNTDMARGKTSLCALRDSYGFLWVGTLTGLSCFDGNGTPVYAASSGVLPSTEGASVCALSEHDGDIWYGTTTGLYVFSRERNRASQFPVKTRYGVQVSSPVQRIAAVGEGLTWILTHGQGFFVYDSSDSTLTQNSRQGAFYSDMVVGPDGCVYAVTLDGYVQTFSAAGNFIRSMRLPDYVTDKNAVRMAYADGSIWVSSHKNLYRYDLSSHAVTLESPAAADDEINAMLPGRKGGLLLGTDDGVWRYKASERTSSRITSPNKTLSASRLLDSRVANLCYDADSSLIVVTSTGGVSHMLWKPSGFTKIDLVPDVESRNLVSALCTASDGAGAWVGSESGLVYYNPLEGTLSRRALPVDGNVEITALDIDGDSLWIGTRHHGLLLLDQSTGKLKEYTYDENTPYAVISNDINKVYRTRFGEIFVLTSWGLCKYNPATDNFSTFAETDSHTTFLTMQEDRHGHLWASNANCTLLRREAPDKEFRPFDSKTLGHSPVSILYRDSAGILWAVTQSNRVFLFNDAENDFQELEISMAKEYPVTFMEEDLDGNLWIGTCGGLARVDKDRNLTYHSFRPETEELPGMEASCRLSDGKILFSGGNGFWIFNPAEVRLGNRMARVYVRSIDFPYMENSSEELARIGLDILLYTRNEIRLPYSDNTFTLSLSASRGSDMPPVRFDYMLEGVDKDWIRGGGPDVTYSDLRPGTYTFLLRPSFGSDAETRRLSIVILHPWYSTWVAFCVYGLLGLLIIWAGVILFRRRIRNHYQNRINTLRIQKEREMFEAKMRFFVNLVHEIRTPLTLISIPLEQMADDARTGVVSADNNEKHISSMRRNVNYLLGIINQLLDFRKAENGREVRLNLASHDLKELLSGICRRFDHPMSSIGKKITLDMPEGGVSATFDIDKTDRVIMNLIGNAVKYSRHKVEVSLRESSGGQICIMVADDGPGIPKPEREKIFDTYYQIEGDNVSAALGTGLGLAYAKLIARAHGGDIKVENNASGGATFTFMLPGGEGATEVPGVTGESGATAPAAAPAGNNGVTVLLVDDNPDLLTTVADALGKSYTVITATDGASALAELQENENIDVIVSDFMMPGMSGAELCRKVKSDVRLSHIPFMILTAKTDNDAKVEGMECGADVYIEKPFSIRQLTLQISNLLRTREQFYARMQSDEIVEVEEKAADEQYLNRIDSEFLNTLNDYIQENISEEDFSIDVLAKQMNMSRSSFYRKLKAVTGMTPVDYLKNFRLDYSVRLLLDGVRVTEVAVLAGFTSSSYFAKCFKAKYGMIPKEYVASRKTR